MTTATIIEGGLKALADSYIGPLKQNASPSQEGNLAGRKVSPHWSFYLLAAGAVAGGAAIVAGVILHVHIYIAAGAFFLITDTIGAYYNYEFKDLLQLSRLTQELTKRVTEITQAILQFGKENDQLKKNVADLNTSLAGVDKEEQKLKSDADELGQDDTKLTADATELAQYRALAKQYQDENKQLKDDSAALKAEVQAFDTKAKTLEASLQAESKENAKLAVELSTFKQQVVAYGKEKGELQALIQKLEGDIAAATAQKEHADVDQRLKNVETSEDNAEKLAKELADSLKTLTEQKK